MTLKDVEFKMNKNESQKMVPLEALMAERAKRKQTYAETLINFTKSKELIDEFAKTAKIMYAISPNGFEKDEECKFTFSINQTTYNYGMGIVAAFIEDNPFYPDSEYQKAIHTSSAINAVTVIWVEGLIYGDGTGHNLFGLEHYLEIVDNKDLLITTNLGELEDSIQFISELLGVGNKIILTGKDGYTELLKHKNSLKENQKFESAGVGTTIEYNKMPILFARHIKDESLYIINTDNIIIAAPMDDFLMAGRPNFMNEPSLSMFIPVVLRTQLVYKTPNCVGKITFK